MVDACPVAVMVGETRVLNAVPKFSWNLSTPELEPVPTLWLLHCCRLGLPKPPLLIALRAPMFARFSPGWMKPTIGVGLVTSTEVLLLMAIDAMTDCVPAKPPPANALALRRTLVMRKMRAVPELAGGRIGMP